MCLSYCYRTRRIFDNHLECQPQCCEHAQAEHPTCDTCGHRLGDLCGLTRHPLPNPSGCCHWNVALINAPQQIDISALQMLGVGANETVSDVLTGFDVPYEIADDGQVWLDLARLSLPDIFGRSTNH